MRCKQLVVEIVLLSWGIQFVQAHRRSSGFLCITFGPFLTTEGNLVPLHREPTFSLGSSVFFCQNTRQRRVKTLF